MSLSSALWVGRRSLAAAGCFCTLSGEKCRLTTRGLAAPPPAIPCSDEPASAVTAPAAAAPAAAGLSSAWARACLLCLGTCAPSGSSTFCVAGLAACPLLRAAFCSFLARAGGWRDSGSGCLRFFAALAAAGLRAPGALPAPRQHPNQCLQLWHSMTWPDMLACCTLALCRSKCFSGCLPGAECWVPASFAALLSPPAGDMYHCGLTFRTALSQRWTRWHQPALAASRHAEAGDASRNVSRHLF